MAKGNDRITPARIHGPRLMLIATVVILLAGGLVMIYSASSIVGLNEYGNSAHYFTRQLSLILAGLVALAIAAWIPYTAWESLLSWSVWAFLVVLLILTLVLGTEELGAKRWVTLFGQSFQPSEFAKIAILLVIASLVVRLREQRIDLSTFIKLMVAAIAVPILLIAVQKDLGTIVIAAFGIIAVFWFGEFPRLPIFIGIGLLVIIGASSIVFEGYRQARISAFIDPWSDPLGSGYQIINAFYAFSDGGLFGVGLGMSRQKFLYLPEAHNDFIFAIIGEELGLVGALAVVILFILFLFAAFRIARNAPDLLGRIIAGTSATLIGSQAFLNIACVVGLAPVTGKPLPFISYGGTSVVAALILVGLILSVSFHSNVPDSASRRRDQLLVLDGGARSRSPQQERGIRGQHPRERTLRTSQRKGSR
ncbi:MAG: putative lipid II flippase FtsW [Coriobacteriaceae bacterium]|nr:putative lipid II flippase FtsW [Coriobacteriaceae bacterium]